MRCREALDRLNQPAPFDWQSDQELINHLKACPACARQAEAARELRQALAEASVHDEADLINWPEQIRRVETAAGTLSYQPKENPIMSALKRQLKLRPRLSVSLAVTAIVLLAAALIPFKFDQTVGFEVAVAGVDRDLALNKDRLNEFLREIGLSTAQISVTGCDTTCNLIVSRLDSPDDAQLVAKAFEEIGKMRVVVSLNEVKEEVSGSAISHAMHKIFVFKSGDHISGEGCDTIIARIANDSSAGGVLFFSDNCTDSGRSLGGVWMDSLSNGDSSRRVVRTMQIMIDSAGANPACSLIRPDQVVDGHLTSDARAALEAQGYTVEETPSADGTLTVKLTRNNSGQSETLVLSLRNCTTDSLPKQSALPEGFELAQNYPNPFNPETTIDYTIPRSEHVTLDIFNINGQKVRTLVDEMKPAGHYSITWNATSDSGERVASGVYLYRLTAGEVSTSKKMTLLK